MNRLGKLAFVLLIGGAVTASADEWKSLFNGKNLDGWVARGGTAPYKVVDGTIVGTYVAGSPNSFLCTEQVFGDFILELEFKVDEECNSGVMFRAQSRPDYKKGVVHGYQCELETSSRRWTGGIYDEQRRGWLYPLTYNPAANDAHKMGEWNKLRIECIGNSLRTWVNGVPAAWLIDDMDASGFFGLQVHAVDKEGNPPKTARWRNIRIKTENIAPSPAPEEQYIRNLIDNNLSEAEKNQGWIQLFDGTTSAGWRGAHKDYFPKGGWKIENGMMTVLESGGGESVNGGDIVTKDEYSAFEFDLEFKPTTGANSGIKYFVTEGYLKEGERRSAIGLEYQILDNQVHPDAKLGRDGNRTMASLYDMKTSATTVIGRTVPQNINGWNHARLIVYPDNRVEHWLNGYKVLEYTRGSDEFYDLVARSKYKVWENFGMAASGHILLQDHGNTVSFKNIKIRPLK
ncbi:MAG: DUF1080 domain-containing protein [Pontiellaceae bacterium]|nr:DUF1080 domain-containing protein [Pontiellaceae bacterium]MBN2783700.1 DUF1080 domain-containing protein [Pontiellaceae bacterium]